MTDAEPNPHESPPDADIDGLDGEVVDAELVDPDVVDAEVVDAEVVGSAEAGSRYALGFDPADLGPDSIEGLIADLESTVAQRDDYLDALRRTQAEFENYRKRVAKQSSDAVERAIGALVEQLLPTLDVGDAAAAHGSADTVVFTSLLGSLEKAGLTRIDPAGEVFDPNDHEAVLHEPADDGAEPRVVEVMRAGYAWKGRVIRPAMVKVRG